VAGGRLERDLAAACCRVEVTASAGRVISIDGPVISTGDLSRQRDLFESVIGMQCLAEHVLDRDTCRALFACSADRATLLQLTTPTSNIGVWLVCFEPLSSVTIREGGVGVGCNALKMIDFFTSDRLAAVDRLRKHGFELVSEGASIDLPDGSKFREAHAKGPDGVMIAAIEPLNVEARDFVTLADRVFSEVQSSSGPVSDFEPVKIFYEQILGISMGLHYEFASESFSRMVGVEQTLTIRANNYGRVIEDVMLGIIHYGLPAGTYEDLRERARPPHRGIVGVRLTVSGLDRIVTHCLEAGLEIPCTPISLRLDESGTLRAAVVRAPHGVWHWLIERQG
jgi:hypothetical protein